MDFEKISPAEELIQKAREAYSAATPKPQLFRGVYKYHSIQDSKAARDRRILEWYLAQQPPKA